MKFYRAVIESVLTKSFTVWYGHTTVDDRKRLNKVVRTATWIVGCELPALEELYRDRVMKKANSIKDDEFHPAHHLIEYLPSEKRYRSLKSRTNRTLYSFYNTAVRTLNEC